MTERAPNWDMTPYFAEFLGEAYCSFRQQLDADVEALLQCARALPPLATDSRCRSIRYSGPAKRKVMRTPISISAGRVSAAEISTLRTMIHGTAPAS